MASGQITPFLSARTFICAVIHAYGNKSYAHNVKLFFFFKSSTCSTRVPRRQNRRRIRSKTRFMESGLHIAQTKFFFSPILQRFLDLFDGDLWPGVSEKGLNADAALLRRCVRHRYVGMKSKHAGLGSAGPLVAGIVIASRGQGRLCRGRTANSHLHLQQDCIRLFPNVILPSILYIFCNMDLVSTFNFIQSYYSLYLFYSMFTLFIDYIYLSNVLILFKIATLCIFLLSIIMLLVCTS